MELDARLRTRLMSQANHVKTKDVCILMQDCERLDNLLLNYEACVASIEYLLTQLSPSYFSMIARFLYLPRPAISPLSHVAFYPGEKQTLCS